MSLQIILYDGDYDVSGYILGIFNFVFVLFFCVFYIDCGEHLVQVHVDKYLELKFYTQNQTS